MGEEDTLPGCVGTLVARLDTTFDDFTKAWELATDDSNCAIRGVMCTELLVLIPPLLVLGTQEAALVVTVLVRMVIGEPLLVPVLLTDH